MKRLFRGGTVVSKNQSTRMDVLVKDEKVLEVSEDLSFIKADEVIDVRGKLLFPGFIDAHTHFDLDVAGTTTADGFDTGTKAEILGGTTCVIDFATQNKGETLHEALENWHEKADGKSSCDYAFHLAISDWNKEVQKELETIVAEGVTSFKLYMTYDAMVVDDKSIYEILTTLKRLGGIAGVHCENKGIIDARLDALKEEKGGRTDVADYPATRPAQAEAEAVNRLLNIARCVDTPVIVVHLSSKEGLAEIRRAREKGQTVYVETCPQYLVMDESRYMLPDNAGAKYMIAPPLRTEKDCEVLWSALEAEELQTIATDHCSFNLEQKAMGRADFSLTPCGMPGAQERPALIYHYGVTKGRLTTEQMCAYLSENPAKLYNLYPQKGCIAPGSDADIVIWNPKGETILSVDTQATDIDYCPLEGAHLTGNVEAVYLRGELIVKDGSILEEHKGIYQKRKV